MSLEVDCDPHAEGFYRAMGMRRAGQSSSGGHPGRMLPHLAKALAVAAGGPRTWRRGDSSAPMAGRFGDADPA